MDVFDAVTVDAGVDVIKQGDMGDNFYIVEDGSLDIHLDKIGKVRVVQMACVAWVVRMLLKHTHAHTH